MKGGNAKSGPLLRIFFKKNYIDIISNASLVQIGKEVGGKDSVIHKESNIAMS